MTPKGQDSSDVGIKIDGMEDITPDLKRVQYTVRKVQVHGAVGTSTQYLHVIFLRKVTYHQPAGFLAELAPVAVH
jgi:hypothetical protein